MSENRPDAPGPGEILRTAREQQGVHIAALAAAIKVSPRKLDALEHDRWDELPDATFIRALAQTVCRTLRVDAAPVLAGLPRAGAVALEGGSGGLNTPFRDRPGRAEPGLGLGAIRPMVIAASVLMVAAVLVYFLPERAWNGLVFVMGASPKAALPASPAGAPVPAADVAVAAQAAQAVVPAVPAAAAPVPAAASAIDPDPSLPVTAGEGPGVPARPAATAATAATAAAAAASAQAQGRPVAVARSAERALSPDRPVPDQGTATTRAARLRTTSKSWVEARDASGQVLLSRMLDAGETVELAGALPLRLLIGNVSGTHLDFHGQSVDLASRSRDNVARIELR